MKALARNYVWWPGMDVDIEEKLALEPLLQGHHYIPGNGPGNPGTRSRWTMPTTAAEICS